MIKQVIYKIKGTVQGVGFRPSVYRLAEEAGLGGWIKNCSGEVQLCLRGDTESISAFMKKLPERIPPNASIVSVSVISARDADKPKGFRIIESSGKGGGRAVIPADIAVCEKCRDDIADPSGRRFEYPFTTCADCGPRYTVIDSMPYDREKTSMKSFPLCPECLKEYNNPEDRRFHAESIACTVCGPKLCLTDISGKRIKTENILAETARLISDGGIVAIKGIGGYQLACDAFNIKVLEKLRKRKKRPSKPFAVMADSIQTVKLFCEVSEKEIGILASSQAPVLILGLKKNPGLPAAGLLSPDTDTLGVLLPTSPLHMLLFKAWREKNGLMVMTSGNRGGEPICVTETEAFERLSGVADYILSHNREINLRNDDSVGTFQAGKFQLIRRARGYAPEPLRLKHKLTRTILAMGAEIKNTVALGYENEIVLSPHTGDLQTPGAYDGMKKVSSALPDFLGRNPEVIAVDMNPDTHSTRYGKIKAAESGIPFFEVQHHYAHALACMAEYGLESAVAIVMDGTGLGPDGNIWGAELLNITKDSWKRMGTFRPVPLPGGDKAVKAPVRQMCARLIASRIPPDFLFTEKYGVTRDFFEIIKIQCEKQINAPVTHAAGRVFDSVSAFLGIAPEYTTYEGQSAIRLEAEALRYTGGSKRILPYKILEQDGLLLIDWRDLFCFLSENIMADIPEKAFEFHFTFADALIRMAEYARNSAGENKIVLSGGVFVNKLLNNLLRPRLQSMGFEVFAHSFTPPNDACIAVGQVIAASVGK